MNILSLFVQLFSTIWFYLFGLLITVITTFFVLPAVFLPLRSKIRYVDHIWGTYGKAIIYLGLFAKVHSEDRRSQEHSKTPSSGIYIANHSSQMDIPLVISMYRIPPIMKKEVLYIPIVGILGYASGAMPVDRSSRLSRKRTVLKTIKRLKSKIGIQYYPEGTRNRESDRPKDFDKIRPKLLRLAYQNNLPVTSTAIWGTKYTFINKFLVKPRQQVGIIVQKEVYPKDFSSEEDFSRHCWKLVQDGYQELDQKLSKN